MPEETTRGERFLNQAFTACKFLSASKGCPVCNTLKMMTSILRVMDSNAFWDFIRFERRQYFLPKKVFFERAADRDTSTSICRRYLFPCWVSFPCDKGIYDLTQRDIVSLIGNIIAETDITSLQLIVHLLLNSCNAFGQTAQLSAHLAHLL